jgi:hypothetical protein
MKPIGVKMVRTLIGASMKFFSKKWNVIKNFNRNLALEIMAMKLIFFVFGTKKRAFVNHKLKKKVAIHFKMNIYVIDRTIVFSSKTILKTKLEELVSTKIVDLLVLHLKLANTRILHIQQFNRVNGMKHPRHVKI